LTEGDTAQDSTELLFHALAKNVRRYRETNNAVQADAASFLLQRRAQPLQQMTAAVRRRNNGLAAFRDSAEIGSLEGEVP